MSNVAILWGGATIFKRVGGSLPNIIYIRVKYWKLFENVIQMEI